MDIATLRLTVFHVHNLHKVHLEVRKKIWKREKKLIFLWYKEIALNLLKRELLAS